MTERRHLACIKNKEDKLNMGKLKDNLSETFKKSLSETILMNLIFWVFCLILFGVIWIWIGEGVGLIFFFLFLAGSFTLVSIFDLIYIHFTGENILNNSDTHSKSK